MEWAKGQAAPHPTNVLDVGGRNINGTPRTLFPADTPYFVIDLVEHESVDWAGDFLEFDSGDTYDLILYMEVAEHTPEWREHLAHAYSLLRPGGQLVITAAAPARSPHSGRHGGSIDPDEWYENIHPDDLFDVISALPGSECNLHVTNDRTDVRACVWRNDG